MSFEKKIQPLIETAREQETAELLSASTILAISNVILAFNAWFVFKYGGDKTLARQIHDHLKHTGIAKKIPIVSMDKGISYRRFKLGKHYFFAGINAPKETLVITTHPFEKDATTKHYKINLLHGSGGIDDIKKTVQRQAKYAIQDFIKNYRDGMKRFDKKTKYNKLYKHTRYSGKLPPAKV